MLTYFVTSSSKLIFDLARSIYTSLRSTLIAKVGNSSSRTIGSLARLMGGRRRQIDDRVVLNVSFSRVKPLSFVCGTLSNLLLKLNVFLFGCACAFFVLNHCVCLVVLRLMTPVTVILVVRSDAHDCFCS